MEPQGVRQQLLGPPARHRPLRAAILLAPVWRQACSPPAAAAVTAVIREWGIAQHPVPASGHSGNADHVPFTPRVLAPRSNCSMATVEYLGQVSNTVAAGSELPRYAGVRRGHRLLCSFIGGGRLHASVFPPEWDDLRTGTMATFAPDRQPAEKPRDKGPKTGALGLGPWPGPLAWALGLASSIVIGVASTAPACSLAATLFFVVAAVGLKSPLVAVLAFVPMLLCSIGFSELNKADPDCGTTFSGALGRSGRRSAGLAAGPPWPPTSWSWPAWPR